MVRGEPGGETGRRWPPQVPSLSSAGSSRLRSQADLGKAAGEEQCKRLEPQNLGNSEPQNTREAEGKEKTALFPCF